MSCYLRTNANIRDPKAYFFISFKKLAIHWIEIIELDETQTESVPTFDYLRTVESNLKYIKSGAQVRKANLKNKGSNHARKPDNQSNYER